ncbi:MAG: helix-turn-helix domain-containing protein [Leptolyngbyaceae cyanobacterium SM2_3_12]|nr:helix-turn-helix domain-containing protein [Leptolyngbyaceae cyanobacterium SM2_3_12]
MANLAPTQVEQLQAIGAYLRQVRQEQGLSLDAVANQIFIRPALLQALETGQGVDLPEAVFIQGFIRRYGEALGLNGQELSQEFAVTPVELMSTPDLLEKAQPNGAGRTDASLTPTPHRGEKAAPIAVSQPGSRKSLLPLLGALGALTLALGLLFWGLFGRNNAPSTTNGTSPSAAVTPEPVTPEPEGSAPTEPAEEILEPLDLGANAAQEAPIVVEASLSDRAWLSVVADGETVYEGTAESGLRETWTAQDTLVVTTGNAGGVELAVNGDEPVALGGNGAVRTLTFTPTSGAETVESP